MLANEVIRNRPMEIKPVDSPGLTKKETEEILDYLFNNLYLFTNQVVAYNFAKYQHVPLEDIKYLKGFERVKQWEHTIQTWHKMAAESAADEIREEYIEKAKRLTEIKRHYRRHHLKKQFAKECREDVFLQTLQQRFTNMPAIVAFNTFFEVSQQFLTDWPRVKEGSRQLRNYQKGMPIYFGYDNNFTPFYTHKKENGKEEIRFKWDIDKVIHFNIEFGRDKSENEGLLRTYIIGQQEGFKRLGDSFIQMDKRKNKIFLNQVFKLPQLPVVENGSKLLDPKLILGIDLGIKVPIYWALSNGANAQPLGTEHKIKKLRSQFYNRINNLQKDLKAEGAEQKGQSARLAPLSKIRKKERELIKQINRNMAKELIAVAVENGAGTIHLEDIDFTEKRALWATGKLLLNEGLNVSKIIKEYDSYYDRMFTMFRNWSYAQLIRFIKEQAENNGIQILFVNAYHTSKRCHVCREKGQRPKQEFLEVRKDTKCQFSNCPAEKEREFKSKDKRQITGYLYLIAADRNAAFNIAKNAKRVIPKEKVGADWNTILKERYNQQKENRYLNKKQP